jgi:hypothetical protein
LLIELWLVVADGLWGSIESFFMLSSAGPRDERELLRVEFLLAIGW